MSICFKHVCLSGFVLCLTGIGFGIDGYYLDKIGLALLANYMIESWSTDQPKQSVEVKEKPKLRIVK
jgi:hypothetical protein